MMAELSDFLGGLVSSINSARVNSDIQSVKIAKEYAANNLLQHFAVPRMRVDKVELNIPIAIESLVEKRQTEYEPIDNKKFSSITYQQILKVLNLVKMPDDISNELQSYIAEHVQLLEAKIRVNQIENALEDFSSFIAQKVIDRINPISGNSKGVVISRAKLDILQKKIIEGLMAALKDEIRIDSGKKELESLQVIVEADKLREVKPEDMIMIKMTISEQGMEWIKMENDKGEIINKLMPE